MSEASKALAEVRGWLCDNLDASDAGHVCGMLSVVSRRVVQADDLESENAKLRELVKDIHTLATDYGVCVQYPYCDAWDEKLAAAEKQMRDLGVEVDE